MRSRPEPWPGLDLAKAVCAVGMVLVHGIFWSWTSGGRVELDPSGLMFRLFRMGSVLGLLPVMLPTLAGIALARRIGGEPLRPDPRLALTISLTGVFIAACGVLTNVLAVSWGMAKAWNVLQFVGLSFQIVALCLLIGSEVALAAAGLVSLVMASPLRLVYINDNPNDWVHIPMWKAVTLGDPHDFHAWALLPWFPTLIFGWFIGRAFVRSGDYRTTAIRVAAICGVLVVAMLPFGPLAPFDAENIIGPSFMIPDAPRALAIAALAGLLVAGTTLLYPKAGPNPSSAIRVWSGGILPVYIVHMSVGNQLSNRLAQSDQESLWRRPFTASAEVRLWMLPAFLLLLSWATAWFTVRLFQDRRLVIRVRRTAVAR